MPRPARSLVGVGWGSGPFGMTNAGAEPWERSLHRLNLELGPSSTVADDDVHVLARPHSGSAQSTRWSVILRPLKVKPKRK
jgi:hypothetical protein